MLNASRANQENVTGKIEHHANDRSEHRFAIHKRLAAGNHSHDNSENGDEIPKEHDQDIARPQYPAPNPDQQGRARERASNDMSAEERPWIGTMIGEIPKKDFRGRKCEENGDQQKTRGAEPVPMMLLTATWNGRHGENRGLY